jgi:hypothetical protein
MPVEDETHLKGAARYRPMTLTAIAQTGLQFDLRSAQGKLIASLSGPQCKRLRYFRFFETRRCTRQNGLVLLGHKNLVTLMAGYSGSVGTSFGGCRAAVKWVILTLWAGHVEGGGEHGAVPFLPGHT